MNSFLRTFLIGFALVLAWATYTEILPARDLKIIASAPAFAAATYVSTDTKQRRRSISYRLNFTYAVDGKKYEIATDWMIERWADEMRAAPVEIAYAPSSPDKAVFKDDFEQRDPSEGVGLAVFAALATSLTMALMAALVSAWFRRRERAQAG